MNTGSWLDAREVLISPATLGAADAQTRTLASECSRQQVETSPSIDLEKTVSRQQELEMRVHYGWPAYWNAARWGASPRDSGDPHLRSSREVMGYHLRALDDTLGHVEDIVVDDESWEVPYLAVDTSNWWFGRHVLISPRWILAVRWPERTVDIAVTRNVIKHSPAWKPSYPITRAYEDDLLEYYSRRQAWSVDPRSNEVPFEMRPSRS